MGARARLAIRVVGLGLAILASTSLASVGAARAEVSVRLSGDPQVVFDSARDGCTPDDVPDIDARAFRAGGEVVMFALQFANRALRGPDLAHLKIDCTSTLRSALDAAPAHYDDRRFLAATWAYDDRHVQALVHHEYHADQHGLCAFRTDLACWYNTITSFRSEDGAYRFVPNKPEVVAAPPFRQDVDQGRHRGFFSPSNIVSFEGATYVFLSTTGWDGQDAGACLFKATANRPDAWRAFDGHSFAIAYSDPYARRPDPHVRPCQVIAPFAFPVGGLVRRRDTGGWIAVFQASKGNGAFPVDGFYYASGRDLTHWSEPRLLFAGQTIMSDLCHGGRSIIGYPALLDPDAKTRNFEDVGSSADLYYVSAEVVGCGTGRRLLLRRRVTFADDGS